MNAYLITIEDGVIEQIKLGKVAVSSYAAMHASLEMYAKRHLGKDYAFKPQLPGRLVPWYVHGHDADIIVE